MTSIYPLVTLVALCACAGRSAPTSEVALADPILDPEVETEVVIACDRSLIFQLAMYYGPRLQEDSLLFNVSGALQFSSPNEDGTTEVCNKTLDPGQLQEFSGLFAELKLQDFPELVDAPFVRDGTTLVLDAICGDEMIKLKARNVFPLPIRNLLDRVNAMVAKAGCNDGFRFPDGKSLKLDSDNMGVTEMCADDCKACNTCSFQ